MQDMLLHSGPLGLAHCLLNIEPLPFCCVSTEDCELMQLEIVQEGRPGSRTPTFSHFTIYCSLQVTLVHLAADAIPLGLCVAGQQVPQMLVRLSNCLVVSLLGFLEHLLGLLNLHLAGCNIYTCWEGVLRTRGFLEILQCIQQFLNSLGKHPELLGQPFLIDDLKEPQKCAQGIPCCSHGSIWACWGGTRLEAWSWRSGVLPWVWWCQPQVHTEWAADETAALSCTQRPSTRPETWGRYSFWRTARVRNLAGVSWKTPFAELVGTQPLEWQLEDLQNAKISWSPPKNSLVPIPHVWLIGWSGTEKFSLLLNALLNVSRVLNSKCPKQRA